MYWETSVGAGAALVTTASWLQYRSKTREALATSSVAVEPQLYKTLLDMPVATAAGIWSFVQAHDSRAVTRTGHFVFVKP
jgi:hypothetical protein